MHFDLDTVTRSNETIVATEDSFKHQVITRVVFGVVPVVVADMNVGSSAYELRVRKVRITAKFRMMDKNDTESTSRRVADETGAVFDENIVKLELAVDGWPFIAQGNTLEAVYRLASPANHTRTFVQTASDVVEARDTAGTVALFKTSPKTQLANGTESDTLLTVDSSSLKLTAAASVLTSAIGHFAHNVTLTYPGLTTTTATAYVAVGYHPDKPQFSLRKLLKAGGSSGGVINATTDDRYFTVEVISFTELDSDGAIVTSIEDLATKDLAFSRVVNSLYQGVPVINANFSGVIPVEYHDGSGVSSCKVNVASYVFTHAALVKNGSETFRVEANSLKFNLEIDGYPFAAPEKRLRARTNITFSGSD